MIVCKFGGTSVGSADRIRQVADIVKRNEKAVVVLSAMSGTTNALEQLIGYLRNTEIDSATQIIQDLREFHISVAIDLFSGTASCDKVEQYVIQQFDQLKLITSRYYTRQLEREILVQGEFLSSYFLSEYLALQGLSVKYISALNFMRTDANNEPDMYYIQERLNDLLQDQDNVNYYITQGYVCKNVYGEIDNLGRGGSDYSASLIAAAIHASCVQIWTDIDGLHNNDPRFVEETYSIQKLTYEEAEELAYFGAKILHPSCIRPAQRSNIPVLVKNTMSAESEGTLIQNLSVEQDFKAVASKDHITVVKIKSARMLMAYGFLRRVFEIFEDFRTPIDTITTSEISVSMTIDQTERLDEIVSELKNLGEVEVIENQSIICVVGDFNGNNGKLINQIGSGLNHLPIQMISFGASNSNISLLINSEYKKEALNCLNVSLFKNVVYV